MQPNLNLLILKGVFFFIYENMAKITIYTDGSAVNKGNGCGDKGGYGIVFINGAIRYFCGGSYQNTTSARMELLACLRGLQKCRVGDDITIWSDSQYVVNCFDKGWIFRWAIQKFKNRYNSDLLKDILNEYNRLECKVKFKWLRGHNGHEMNELADKLAKRGATRKQYFIDLKM